MLGLLLLALTTAAAGSEPLARRTSRGWTALPGAPMADRVTATTSHFGASRTDDYAWLRAANWQQVLDDPGKLPANIRRHLDAENRYARRTLAPTRRVQKKLMAEMRGRIEQSWSSPAMPDGPWEYFERFVKGREHAAYWRRLRGGGRSQLLLDANRLARGKAAFDIAGVRHSPDHRILAYAVDTIGSEDFTIRFRDLATGRDLPDVIESTEGVPVWAADSRTVLYAERRNSRALTIRRHTLGAAVASDAIVYRETDPAFLVSVHKMSSGSHFVITAADSRTQEVRVLAADRPYEEPRLVAERRDGERHWVEHAGDRFIIKTNAGGAFDFRIVEAPVAAPERGNWRELVAHRPGAAIQDTQLTAHHLVRIERQEARDRIVVRRLADGDEHTIAFQEEPFTVALQSGFEFATDTLRYTHETMRRSQRVIDYDMASRKQRVRRVQAVPSGHDPGRYTTLRLFAGAYDGARIPVSVLHRRGLRLDHSAPLLLHGYGAYGDATDANFDSTLLSLVDRGFVVAIAHVRGGNEMGERWREAGMLDAKINSFRDFLSVGEFLAEAGYTSRGRIVASGFSAGGLLVAGAANMRPDLFMGVIALSPFVDALATMLDASLPLTPTEWNEWGNPIESRAAFEAIRAYSPYDNIKAQAYPAVFATGSLTDPRVTYWEPAKWVARLRAMKTDRNPVLLMTETAAGHEGPAGRFQRLEEKARTYAFALELARTTERRVNNGRKQKRFVIPDRQRASAGDPMPPSALARRLHGVTAAKPADRPIARPPRTIRSLRPRTRRDQAEVRAVSRLLIGNSMLAAAVLGSSTRWQGAPAQRVCGGMLSPFMTTVSGASCA